MGKNTFCFKISLVAASVLLCSSIAQAAAYTSTSGAALTVGTTGSDPAVLTYNPSPGVSMAVFASATAYSIATINTSAGAGARNEYLIRSDKTGYYQRQTDTISALTAVDPTTTSYTYMGGGS